MAAVRWPRAGKVTLDVSRDQVPHKDLPVVAAGGQEGRETLVLYLAPPLGTVQEYHSIILLFSIYSIILLYCILLNVSLFVPASSTSLANKSLNDQQQEWAVL